MAAREKKWQDFVHSKAIAFCDERGKREFKPREFFDRYEDEFRAFSERNHFPYEKIRQQLIFLRRSGRIQSPRHGVYRLCDLTIAEIIEEFDKVYPHMRGDIPEKKEYMYEVFSCPQWMTKTAHKHFGHGCMYRDCENGFIMQNSKPYIEVHHITPLCDGGRGDLWNLSVLCAHHHRMAHFSQKTVKHDIEKYLLDEVQERLRVIFG